LYKGKKIRAWGGPGESTVEMDGAQWLPSQLSTFPTPPFPDYVSGHSTYSAAARILALWTGSDRFDDSVTLGRKFEGLARHHSSQATDTYYSEHLISDTFHVAACRTWRSQK